MQVEENGGSQPVGGVPIHSGDAPSQTVRFDAAYGAAAPIVLLELPDAHVRSSIQSGEYGGERREEQYKSDGKRLAVRG